MRRSGLLYTKYCEKRVVSAEIENFFLTKGGSRVNIQVYYNG